MLSPIHKNNKRSTNRVSRSALRLSIWHFDYELYIVRIIHETIGLVNPAGMFYKQLIVETYFPQALAVEERPSEFPMRKF